MTYKKKTKRSKKRFSLKDEFVIRDDPQNYDEPVYLLKSPKNALRLLETSESL